MSSPTYPEGPAFRPVVPVYDLTEDDCCCPETTRCPMTLPQILTRAEIKKAIRLKDRIAVRDQIIIPNMARINRSLGQENNPDYLAYAVEYVLTSAGEW